MEWEDRSFFPYMNVSAHHVISKEVVISRYIKKSIFRHNWIFRHIHWQSSGIIVRIILSTQKFSLKKKLTNLLLVTAVCQFTAKTTNSEKSIYFLSLTSCSIRKLKFHMLFTCKNFVFRFYVKKNFCSKKCAPCIYELQSGFRKKGSTCQV